MTDHLIRDDRVGTLLREGRAAAEAGRKGQARLKFRALLLLDPAHVTALLWLAWLSDDPHASLAYVARALAANPQDPRAHAALRWARQRVPTPALREPLAAPSSTPAVRHQHGHPALRANVGRLMAVGLLVVLVAAGLVRLLPSGIFDHSDARDVPVPLIRNGLPVLAAPAPTHTPTPTPTNTPTPTPTYAPTLTHTPPPTHTPTRPPADTPTPSPTATPRPALSTPPPLPPTATLAPLSVQSNLRWIDVDLTYQVLTAYEGQAPVRTILVSTGLPRTPTPVGQYYIQLKLRYDDMSGPGYYLPDVPYVMYFFRGFSLHGTYWHSNFGHPMSHGCVNLPTPEAEWLFNWAEVGTFVNVHY